jgi:hypothetical protein
LAGTILCRAVEGLIDEGTVSPAAAAAAALPMYFRAPEEIAALLAGAAGEWELLERRVEVVGHPAWARCCAGGITPAQLAEEFVTAWAAVTEPGLTRGLAAAARKGAGAAAPAGLTATGPSGAAGGGDGSAAEAAAAAVLEESYRRIRAGLEARPGPLESSTTYLLLRRR